MPFILLPPIGGDKRGGRNSDILLSQKTPFTGARNFDPLKSILTQFKAILKWVVLCCPYCGQAYVIKYGFYLRDPVRLPNCLSKPLKIQRFQCKNRRCNHCRGTFSFPPYPLLPRLGIPVTELLDLAITLAPVTWLVLFRYFPGHGYIVLRGWRRRAGDFLEWLKTSAILEEPHLTWPQFQFAFSRHFYPPGPAP